MDGPARQLLRKHSLFSRLGNATLAEVAERAVIRALPRGKHLFRRGDRPRGLYLVVDGAVRVYREGVSGQERTLSVAGAGQSVGEIAVLDGGPHPASARAETECRILFLPVEEFRWLYRNRPDVADSLVREMGRRLRRLAGRVEKVALGDVLSRVAVTLLEEVESASRPADGLVLELPRTQEEMADELVTTRESVARALARLRQDGVIEQRGPRVRILDLARLESAAFGGGQ